MPVDGKHGKAGWPSGTPHDRGPCGRTGGRHGHDPSAAAVGRMRAPAPRARCRGCPPLRPTLPVTGNMRGAWLAGPPRGGEPVPPKAGTCAQVLDPPQAYGEGDGGSGRTARRGLRRAALLKAANAAAAADRAARVTTVRARTCSGAHQRVSAAKAGRQNVRAMAIPPRAQPDWKTACFGATATTRRLRVARTDPLVMTVRGAARVENAVDAYAGERGDGQGQGERGRGRPGGPPGGGR